MVGYWRYETSGVLRPAIEAYLIGEIDAGAPPMTEQQIAAMRGYLRQWISDPGWRGPMVDVLRGSIDDLTSVEAITRWLDRAIDQGIDPL